MLGTKREDEKSTYTVKYVKVHFSYTLKREYEKSFALERGEGRERERDRKRERERIRVTQWCILNFKAMLKEHKWHRH